MPAPRKSAPGIPPAAAVLAGVLAAGDPPEEATGSRKGRATPAAGPARGPTGIHRAAVALAPTRAGSSPAARHPDRAATAADWAGAAAQGRAEGNPALRWPAAAPVASVEAPEVPVAVVATGPEPAAAQGEAGREVVQAAARGVVVPGKAEAPGKAAALAVVPDRAAALEPVVVPAWVAVPGEVEVPGSALVPDGAAVARAPAPARSCSAPGT
jgi:hypothetical protein